MKKDSMAKDVHEEGLHGQGHDEEVSASGGAAGTDGHACAVRAQGEVIDASPPMSTAMTRVQQPDIRQGSKSRHTVWGLFALGK